MKKILIVAALLVTGCNNPVAPAQAESYKPAHHNIPATDSAGTVWFVCETKPRTYLRQVGDAWVRTTAADHYIQRETCPSTPID